MAFIQAAKIALILLLVLVSFVQPSSSRKLKVKTNNLMIYHKGAVLQGNIPLSILWYGEFTATQKSIMTDFLQSLTPSGFTTNAQSFGSVPSVSQWWKIIDQAYISKAISNAKTNIFLDNQVDDTQCSLGKQLKQSQITQLVSKVTPKTGGIALVFTAQDVAVEGFGMSRCGLHRFDTTTNSAYIWVGNPATQCPGQCAWPFAKPLYGPQTPALVPPNGDVGLDGMVINVAELMAGTVTNPNGKGFYLGPQGSSVEVATACSGIYGQGAFPGYAGKLLTDSSTGASYNARGNNKRNYLVPSLYNPSTSSCFTLV